MNTNVTVESFGIDLSAPSLWIAFVLIVIGVTVGLLWFFRKSK